MNVFQISTRLQGTLKKVLAQTFLSMKNLTRCHNSPVKMLDKVICANAVESVSQRPDGYFDFIIFFDIPEHFAVIVGPTLQSK